MTAPTRLLFRSGLFVVVFMIVGSLLIQEFVIETGVFKRRVLGGEIYAAEERSLVSTDAGILILGDSVGGQIYPQGRSTDYVKILTTNAAITFVGQYILFHNVVRSSSNLKRVYLLVHPQLFTSNLANERTYNYFLKPFYNEKYIRLLDRSSNEMISDIPFYWLAQWSLVRCNNWAPSFHADIHESLAVEMNIEYVKRIVSEAKNCGIDVVFSAPPIKEKLSRSTLLEIEQMMNKVGLGGLWRSYTRTFQYWPKNRFVDEVHLEDRFIPVDPFQVL